MLEAYQSHGICKKSSRFDRETFVDSSQFAHQKSPSEMITNINKYQVQR